MRPLRGLVAGVLILLAGCAGKATTPVTSPVAKPPSLAGLGPEDFARAVTGLWDQRNWDSYSWTLTDDFQFVFAPSDSAGNAFLGRCMNRDIEVLAAKRMFEAGTDLEPPFVSVSFVLGPGLLNLPDPRPGKDPTVHRLIRGPFTFSADQGQAEFRITGNVNFYLVRGDSAAIPAGLDALGAAPDPDRWWLERWEDESSDSYAAVETQPLPTRRSTLGAVKSLYAR